MGFFRYRSLNQFAGFGRKWNLPRYVQGVTGFDSLVVKAYWCRCCCGIDDFFTHKLTEEKTLDNFIQDGQYEQDNRRGIDGMHDTEIETRRSVRIFFPEKIQLISPVLTRALLVCWPC